jgi:transposase
VFDAHNRAFAFFGGVTRRGIYDNLKTCVDAVLRGKDRRFNARFLQLCEHYLLEPTACTPAAGWEKGQVENQVKSGTMSSQVEQPGEHGMVSKERWETIRRLLVEERVSVSEIARRMDLDRKTVRRWVRQEQWKSYARATRTDTLLADHEQFVRERAPQVNYSARIVFQELKHQHGFSGSYETVKRGGPAASSRASAMRA